MMTREGVAMKCEWKWWVELPGKLSRWELMQLAGASMLSLFLFLLAWNGAVIARAPAACCVHEIMFRMNLSAAVDGGAQTRKESETSTRLCMKPP